MLEQVELAKDQAEKANHAKTDFLSSMSHEIRTPLNAIVGLSEDIESYKDEVPAEVVEDSIDIRNASQTLLEIVGNILDINNKLRHTNYPVVDKDNNPQISMKYNKIRKMDISNGPGIRISIFLLSCESIFTTILDGEFRLYPLIQLILFL